MAADVQVKFRSKTSAGAYEQNTVDATTAEGLTVPAGAQFCRITSNAAIRWRDDGTDPTSAIGMPVAANAPFDYDGPLSALKIISQSGNAVLGISYYKYVG